MGDWQVFTDKTRELLESKKFTEAREEVLAGLEKLPNQVNLLTIATDVFRASNDRERSLEYAELLVAHHPDNWNGYALAAQDLVALKRFEEAQKQIQSGFKKLPNQVNLLTISADLCSEMGDQNKSLQFARIISIEYPEKNKGCPYPIQQLIRNLRNRRNVMENWDDFLSLMEGITVENLSVFNLKWLKSICDTYVDHDESRRGLIAMSISTFLNTLKVAETSRALRATNPAEIRHFLRKQLYDGYSSLHLKRQDACLTFSWRMKWIVRSDPLMKAIWEEVLSRIHVHSNLLKELIEFSEFPERYFPIDPTGIKDNYGLTYEQLYQ